MLEFRVLGPVEVVEGGRTLPPLPPKQRALLVALLLRTGRVVSRDQLVDELWGDDVPPTAVNSLENAVSHLRKALGRDVLVTRPPGYLLSVDPEQVDALRFERLVARARDAEPEERAARLREGLALFRGPPLADAELGRAAESEARRLRELELAAREALVAAELELGRHAEVVAELERLVVEHPFRERLHALLMLALYRSGRQADALAAYRAARRTLVDELGTEPGEDLRELERAILRHDPALRGPAAPAAAGPARAARKTVTVLACTLDAARPSERLDPERLREALDRFAEAVRGAVERYGGTVIALSGDAATAVFGVPSVREDDAARAVRAGVALRDRHEGPAPGLGVETGEVLLERSGITGAPVALAQQLARAATPGEILLGESTERFLRDVAEFDPVERDGPGGRRGRTFRLVSLPAGGRALRLDAPLVGREPELTELAAAFDVAVRERSCRLVAVVGAAGVGKSRLVRELGERLGDRATVLSGRCLPYGEGTAFQPLAEVVRASGATPDIRVPQPAQATFREARVRFETLARERPLLVVFEDVHWAGAAFLDLVESLVDHARRAPILVVCTARPELLDHRPSWQREGPRSHVLALGPLGPADSERLVDGLLGESDLPDPVIAHIVRSADGYPLFVEELLATLVDTAVLRRVGGRWTTSELPALAVPPTVQALIAARLDRLPDRERLVLDLASVQGASFSAAAISVLAPAESAASVEADLGALVERQLIRRDGDGTFSFRHELVRDAAYESLPKRDRAELHERFADRLAQAPGGADDEIVGHHLERAHLFAAELGAPPDVLARLARRAGDRLASAGTRAAAHGDPLAAAALLARAVALLPREAAERRRLVADLERAVAAVEALGDARAAAPARRLLDATSDAPRPSG